MKEFKSFADTYDTHARIFQWIQRSLRVGNLRGNPSMKIVALRAYKDFMHFHALLTESCESLGPRNHGKKNFYGLLDKTMKLRVKWMQVNAYVEHTL